MQKSSLNPFVEQAASDNYKGADRVYQLSASAALNFLEKECSFSKPRVLDIGAGTGISSRNLLSSKLEAVVNIAEPSIAMINKAKEQLGSAVQEYFNLGVDELQANIQGLYDIALALNCVHLFPDQTKAAQNIASILKPGGLFLFNNARPSYIFTNETALELQTLRANLDFYLFLYEATGMQVEILASSIVLLSQALEASVPVQEKSLSKVLHSQKKVEATFASFNMQLKAYKEESLKINADDQRNIWRIVASSFIANPQKVENLVNKPLLPEELAIRQSFFLLVKDC